MARRPLCFLRLAGWLPCWEKADHSAPQVCSRKDVLLKHFLDVMTSSLWLKALENEGYVPLSINPYKLPTNNRAGKTGGLLAGWREL